MTTQQTVGAARTLAAVLGLLLLKVHPAASATFDADTRLQGLACAHEDGGLQFVEAGTVLPPHCLPLARGSYVDAAITNSNFGKLRIVANGSEPALQRYRAAGFLEGYLTAIRIWHHFQNMKAYFEDQLYPGVDLWGPPMDWLAQQEAWVRDQIAAQAGAAQHAQQQPLQHNGAPSGALDPDLPIFSAVELLLAQFDGMVEGYAARAADEAQRCSAAAGSTCTPRLQPLTRRHHVFMQNNGELYDITDGWLAGEWGNATAHHDRLLSSHPDHGGSGSPADEVQRQRAQRRAWAALRAARMAGRSSGSSSAGASGAQRSPEDWLRLVSIAERCSALIKVTGDLSNLLIGHATWDSFTNMLHIFKHYDLGRPGFGRLSFSSYPGETFSDDDFYLSESGLVVLETTNHVFDPSVYSALTPASLLSWQRVRAAMMVAGSGDAWVRAFSTLNSGTYNNQYMVVDLARFMPKRELQAGLLWVVEQLPGLVVALDMTDVIARGYWGSYNVPFFPQVYNRSGYPEMESAILTDQEAVGDGHDRLKERYTLPISWLRYQSAPRASIFRRDQAAAQDLATFKDLIRYNNYKKDPYSKGAPMAAVCGRSDLPYAAPQGARAAEARRRLVSAVTTSGTPRVHTSTHAPALGMKLPLEPRGCYDGKVTSYDLALKLQSEVVNGPTTSHGLPPFRWGPWNADYVHVGHPDEFDFTWERMAAEDLPLP